MSTVFTLCPNCRATHDWSWEEAFDKFGFSDGDGLVMTHAVATVLRQHGYAVESLPWGLHNEIITSIQKDGETLIPASARIGYDDPHDYLPDDIVTLLDAAFPDGKEVMA